MKKLVLFVITIIWMASACSYKSAKVDPISIKDAGGKVIEKSISSEVDSVDAKELGKKAGQLLKSLGEKGKDFLKGFDEETNIKESVSEGSNKVKEDFSKILDKVKNK